MVPDTTQLSILSHITQHPWFSPAAFGGGFYLFISLFAESLSLSRLMRIILAVVAGISYKIFAAPIWLYIQSIFAVIGLHAPH